jgi:CPA2 family monovalent cation:H+ antiporter-2
MPFETLRDLEILFGLAVITVVLFRRLLFPSIIGFLVTGVLAGPHALALIKDPHTVEQMAEIGVVLLLFTIGIEFSLSELMRIRKLVFWGGGIQVLVTIVVVAAGGVLFGLPYNQAVFAGFLVSLSSTAILMKLLMDAGEMDTPHGKTALGILIFQDLCVVPLMLFTPFLAGAGNGWEGMATTILKALAVVAVAHVGARYAVPWIFSQVVQARSRELFLLTIIFVGLGTAWLTALAGLSLALGAFIAGLAVSESEYSHQALGDLIPFRDAFMSLFFISVGMLLDLTIFLRQPLLLLTIVLAVVLIKTIVATGSTMLLGLPGRIALVAGLSLAQVGEFSFVLAQSGVTLGLLPAEAYQLFLASSVLTMALTPLLLAKGQVVADALLPLLPRRLVRGAGALVERERKGHYDDHVIIVGYGLNGRNLAKVLKHRHIQYVIVETNPFTVSSQRKKGEHIVFGDASKQEVLEHLQIERARLMVVAISDAASSRRIVAIARQQSPRLHIIVRTRYVLEMEPLFKLGVNEVVPEEFETSIEIFARVLRKYLVTEEEIDASVADIRGDSYEMFRGISRRHSHAVGITGFLAGAEVAAFTVSKSSPVESTLLRDGIIRERSGATVLVIKRGDEVAPNPDPVWELRADDVVLLLGSPKQMAVAAPLFEPVAAKSS